LQKYFSNSFDQPPLSVFCGCKYKRDIHTAQPLGLNFYSLPLGLVFKALQYSELRLKKKNSPAFPDF
jgi:hypothetical protein